MSGTVTFGSAQLLVHRMPETVARALLERALQAGASRLDTAPLYGHGQSEALVSRVAAHHGSVAVTTKVGLEPIPPPPAWRWAASAALRRMPALARATGALRSRFQAADDASQDLQARTTSGRFDTAAVQRSVERSLRRLGRIDRLLLHEVHLPDLTDELLHLLQAYQRRGDVAELGLATGNGITLAALQRGGGLFTVVHLSADPRQPDVMPALCMPCAERPSAVHVVGHGALGADGRTLIAVQQRLHQDVALRQRWITAVRGTPLSGQDGLAEALFAHARGRGFTELLVATRRLHRVAATVHAAARAQPLPVTALHLLDELLSHRRR